MHAPFRVLLPKRIFEQSNNELEVQALTKEYMQRYPHYSIIRIENSYAICERKTVQEGKDG